MLLDVFNGAPFNVQSLTDAINKIPYKPSRIGAMGLFDTRGVTTTSVMIEEKNRVLSLLPVSARGAPPSVARPELRVARSLRIPHISLDAAVYADEVQNIRAFGSQTEVEAVAGVVNDKIQSMKQSHEVTLEYHRLGAMKGVIYDADGTTVIYNLFNEFGIVAPDIHEFDLTAHTPTLRATCMAIKRAIEAALGGAPYDHIHAFCGSTFFDAFVGDAEIAAAYAMWAMNGQLGAFLRNDMRKGFAYGDIIFEEYPGTIGTIAMIAATEAYFFPVGMPGLFQTYYAPADYIETVNTVGLPFYAKQQVMDFDKGITIDTQQNPLCICTHPLALRRAVQV